VSQTVAHSWPGNSHSKACLERSEGNSLAAVDATNAQPITPLD
jgi:hypothetical protein